MIKSFRDKRTAALFLGNDKMLNRDKIANTDLSAVSTGEALGPVHPGAHLLDYIEGAGITQYRLAKAIHVPPRRINEIVHGKRSITADTALRLGRYFRTSPQFWMNLQTTYDLAVAESKIGERLTQEIDPVAA